MFFGLWYFTFKHKKKWHTDRKNWNMVEVRVKVMNHLNFNDLCMIFTPSRNVHWNNFSKKISNIARQILSLNCCIISLGCANIHLISWVLLFSLNMLSKFIRVKLKVQCHKIFDTLSLGPLGAGKNTVSLTFCFCEDIRLQSLKFT